LVDDTVSKSKRTPMSLLFLPMLSARRFADADNPVEDTLLPPRSIMLAKPESRGRERCIQAATLGVSDAGGEQYVCAIASGTWDAKG